MLVFGTNNLFISKKAREVRRKRIKTVQAELISAAIQAIQETFRATKRKHVRNIAGYFNGVLSNKLDDLMSEIMAR